MTRPLLRGFLRARAWKAEPRTRSFRTVQTLESRACLAATMEAILWNAGAIQNSILDLPSDDESTDSNEDAISNGETIQVADLIINSLTAGLLDDIDSHLGVFDDLGLDHAPETDATTLPDELFSEGRNEELREPGNEFLPKDDAGNVSDESEWPLIEGIVDETSSDDANDRESEIGIDQPPTQDDSSEIPDESFIEESESVTNESPPTTGFAPSDSKQSNSNGEKHVGEISGQGPNSIPHEQNQAGSNQYAAQSSNLPPVVGPRLSMVASLPMPAATMTSISNATAFTFKDITSIAIRQAFTSSDANIQLTLKLQPQPSGPQQVDGLVDLGSKFLHQSPVATKAPLPSSVSQPSLPCQSPDLNALQVRPRLVPVQPMVPIVPNHPAPLPILIRVESAPPTPAVEPKSLRNLPPQSSGLSAPSPCQTTTNLKETNATPHSGLLS